MFGAYITLIPLSCLSWAAKLGLSPTTRSILGQHAGALTDSFTIYSRDLAIAPAPELQQMWSWRLQREPAVACREDFRGLMASPCLMVNSPFSLVNPTHSLGESPSFLTTRRQRQGGSRPNSRQQQPQPAAPAQQVHPEHPRNRKRFIIHIFLRYFPGIYIYNYI